MDPGQAGQLALIGHRQGWSPNVPPPRRRPPERHRLDRPGPAGRARGAGPHRRARGLGQPQAGVGDRLGPGGGLHPGRRRPVLPARRCRRLPKHRRDKQAFVSNAIAIAHRGWARRRQPPRASGRTGCRPSSRLNRNLGALPMVGGNTAELDRRTTAARIDAMAADDRPGGDVRPRRVLHPRPRRDDRAALRRDGAGRAPAG